MNGELQADTIIPSGELSVEGKLKVQNTLTMDQLADLPDDKLSQATVLVRQNDDNSVKGVSLDSLMPAGTIISYGGENEPSGWLLCDGRYFSKSDGAYQRLLTAIGTSWGENSTGTEFRIPDLRGRFLRGIDDGAGLDPGADIGAEANDKRTNSDDEEVGSIVGSLQDDAFQGHIHDGDFASMYHGSGGHNLGNIAYYMGKATQSGYVADGIKGNPRAASETRPKNAAVMYIIKY